MTHLDIKNNVIENDSGIDTSYLIAISDYATQMLDEISQDLFNESFFKGKHDIFVNMFVYKAKVMGLTAQVLSDVAKDVLKILFSDQPEFESFLKAVENKEFMANENLHSALDHFILELDKESGFSGAIKKFQSETKQMKLPFGDQKIYLKMVLMDTGFLTSEEKKARLATLEQIDFATLEIPQPQEMRQRQHSVQQPQPQEMRQRQLHSVQQPQLREVRRPVERNETSACLSTVVLTLAILTTSLAIGILLQK